MYFIRWTCGFQSLFPFGLCSVLVSYTNHNLLKSTKIITDNRIWLSFEVLQPCLFLAWDISEPHGELFSTCLLAALQTTLPLFLYKYVHLCNNFCKLEMGSFAHRVCAFLLPNYLLEGLCRFICAVQRNKYSPTFGLSLCFWKDAPFPVVFTREFNLLWHATFTTLTSKSWALQAPFLDYLSSDWPEHLSCVHGTSWVLCTVFQLGNRYPPLPLPQTFEYSRTMILSGPQSKLSLKPA